MFPVAGTLRAQAAADAVLRRLPPTGRLVVSDAWACLDLAGLGLVSRPGDPWMLRSAGAALPEIGAVPDLEILRASTPDEVRSVEATIISAAGVVPPGYRPESIHAPQGSLEQTDLHLFLGLYRGVPMATAMAAVARHVVFVSGVSTMTSVRGRGIATAMTLAAMAVAPDRPAALATTSMGRPIYERLGFEIVGRPVTWHRAAS